MLSVLSFLKRFWPGRRRSPSSVAPPGQSEPRVDAADGRQSFAVLEAGPEQAPAGRPAALDVPSSPFAGAADQAEVEDDDEAAVDEDDSEDELGPDPFATLETPPATMLSAGTIERARLEARAEALSGEHKIYLTTLAGPGSLAEALGQLVEEGRVTAEFRDDGPDEPYILYRPKH